MSDDIVVELIDSKVHEHELEQPHGNSEDAECRAEVAALRARVEELESNHHIHDDEFEEAEDEPVIEEV